MQDRAKFSGVATDVIFGTAGVLFLGAYSARYGFIDSLWFLQLFASFLPFLSTCVVLILVLSLARKSFFYRAIFIALVVLIIVRFYHPNRLTSEDPSAGETVSILCFNTGPHFNTAEESAEFLSLLESVSPDYVALQESYYRYDDSLGSVLYRAPIGDLLALGFKVISAVEPRNGESLNVTLKGPGVISAISPHAKDHESENNFNPGFKRTVIMAGDHVVALYNIHLVSFRRTSILASGAGTTLAQKISDIKMTILERIRQSEVIAEYLTGETIPFVLCGDFNSTENGYAYNRIRAVARDVFLTSGHGSGATYPSGFPMFRIDHVFASPDIVVEEIRIHRQGLSDHFAQSIKMYLRK